MVTVWSTYCGSRVATLAVAQTRKSSNNYLHNNHVTYYTTVLQLTSIYITASLFEFLMLGHGILTIHADFTRRDFEDSIRTVCYDWCR